MRWRPLCQHPALPASTCVALTGHPVAVLGTDGPGPNHTNTIRNAAMRAVPPRQDIVHHRCMSYRNTWPPSTVGGQQTGQGAPASSVCPAAPDAAAAAAPPRARRAGAEAASTAADWLPGERLRVSGTMHACCKRYTSQSNLAVSQCMMLKQPDEGKPIQAIN